MLINFFFVEGVGGCLTHLDVSANPNLWTKHVPDSFVKHLRSSSNGLLSFHVGLLPCQTVSIERKIETLTYKLPVNPIKCDHEKGKEKKKEKAGVKYEEDLYGREWGPLGVVWGLWDRPFPDKLAYLQKWNNRLPFVDAPITWWHSIGSIDESAVVKQARYDPHQQDDALVQEVVKDGDCDDNLAAYALFIVKGDKVHPSH